MGELRRAWGGSAGQAGVVLAAVALLVLPGVGPGGAPAAAASGELPIVFGTNPSATDPKVNGIGVVNADGSGRRFVVSPPTENEYFVQPDLSPDGRRIVFAHCDRRYFRYANQQCLLATVNVDGSDLRQLGGNVSPRWSPDGTRIAFIYYEAGNGEAHLSVMAADGSGFREVAKILGDDVDWSPDGKTLVFASFTFEGDEPTPPMLYTVPVDGSAAPRLLGAGIRGEDPSWSPDGTQIAFTRMPANRDRMAVSVVNADGSGLRDIVRSDDTSFGRPGWSPDSRRIAVATYVNRPDGTTETPVSTYDLVTGAVTPVLPDGGGSLSWANPAGPTPCSSGYWLVAGDGGVFSFGTAAFFGSAKPARPRRPVVGMAASPSGRGYWLVASDGGVFAFGDAGFFGSTGGLSLNQPIVGMAASPSGRGYWLVASDGGVFSFGDAEFFGSTGGLSLNKPVVSIAASPSGRGYWLVGADGGIFPFGDAARVGSAASPGLPAAIVGASATGAALLIAGADGSVVPFGHARFCGSMYGRRLGSPSVGVALQPPA